MLKKIVCTVSLLALWTSFDAMAQAPKGAALAQQYGCLNCHQVDQKLVGPSYKSVADKYKADAAGSSPMLAAKIKSGGAGNWGRIPMPPHPNVSDEDAKSLVSWILSL